LIVTFEGGVPTTQMSSSVSLAAPHYLRVTRTGDYWSLVYSANGTDWSVGASFTHQLNVSSVGLYAGNAGGAQAHTAIIDYFFNTAAPVTPEDGGAL
jgi:hypothetical protein